MRFFCPRSAVDAEREDLRKASHSQNAHHRSGMVKACVDPGAENIMEIDDPPFVAFGPPLGLDAHRPHKRKSYGACGGGWQWPRRSWRSSRLTPAVTLHSPGAQIVHQVVRTNSPEAVPFSGVAGIVMGVAYRGLGLGFAAAVLFWSHAHRPICEAANRNACSSRGRSYTITAISAIRASRCTAASSMSGYSLAVLSAELTPHRWTLEKSPKGNL
ncbi:MAG: hypothetical protein JWO04_1787 [Gammaproteobacteria bacterium]|nr:hypothetical protein [Gammaproteobacteria bacterium]